MSLNLQSPIIENKNVKDTKEKTLGELLFLTELEKHPRGRGSYFEMIEMPLEKILKRIEY